VHLAAPHEGRGRVFPICRAALKVGCGEEDLVGCLNGWKIGCVKIADGNWKLR